MNDLVIYNDKGWFHCLTSSKKHLLVAAIGLSLISGGIGAGITSFCLKNSSLSANPHAESVKNKSVSNGQQPTNALVDSSELDAKKIEKALIDNPDMVIKALAKYRFIQEQKQGKAEEKLLDNYSERLFGDNLDPSYGNHDSDMQIIEFVDFNCGWCKKVHKEVSSFVNNDGGRVIVKHLPILNAPSSKWGAKVGIALAQVAPGKYEEYHSAMMMSKQLSVKDVNNIVESIGVKMTDLEPLFEQAEKQISKNKILATKLGVRGTPAIFANGQRLGGNATAESILNAFN